MSRTVAALVQVAELSKLRHADDRRLPDLQTWLKDLELGGDFLQSTEVQTWTNRHKSGSRSAGGSTSRRGVALASFSGTATRSDALIFGW